MEWRRRSSPTIIFILLLLLPGAISRSVRTDLPEFKFDFFPEEFPTTAAGSSEPQPAKKASSSFPLKPLIAVCSVISGIVAGNILARSKLEISKPKFATTVPEKVKSFVEKLKHMGSKKTSEKLQQAEEAMQLLQEKEKLVEKLARDLKQKTSENEKLHDIIAQMKQKMKQIAIDKDELRQSLTEEILSLKDEANKLLDQQRSEFEYLARQEREQITAEFTQENEELQNLIEQLKLRERDVIEQEVKKVQSEMASILNEERQLLKQHMAQALQKMKQDMILNQDGRQ